jgi:hypothetical protein
MACLFTIVRRMGSHLFLSNDIALIREEKQAACQKRKMGEMSQR